MSVTATASPAVAAPAKPEPLSVFPTDALTVPDPSQLTGRRVALPVEGCGAPIVCGLVQRLDELDGFDLDPRLAVRFSAPVDPAEVDDRITIQDAHSGWPTGVDRVVYDPDTYTVYAHPAEQLASGTTYRLRVQLHGHVAPAVDGLGPVDAGGVAAAPVGQHGHLRGLGAVHGHHHHGVGHGRVAAGVPLGQVAALHGLGRLGGPGVGGVPVDAGVVAVGHHGDGLGQVGGQGVHHGQ